MSDAPNTVSTLNGLLKTIYGKESIDLRPDHVKLSKAVPFIEKKKMNGANYNQTIVVKSEHGVTYGGSAGDAFTYNDAIAGATVQATIAPSVMVLKSQISRTAIQRTENLTEGAVANATKHVIENMLLSMANKYEAQCFYGGVGLATVASVAGSVITITTDQFAPGIWVGGEGMKLDVYASDDTTSHNAGTSITAVDLEARTITLSSVTNIVAGDIIYEAGAKGKEFLGVFGMLNATSGNVFGQSVSSYSLWRGNKYNVNGALSFAKISAAIAGAVAKGVAGKLTLFINPKTWSTLLTEQTAQRTFHEGGMTQYNQGAESIEFFAINGKIEIIASTFVKESHAFALDLNCFMRIGSSDITLEDPMQKGKYVVALENSNAYQFLAYTDSALFCSSLGRNVLLYNISNAA